MKKAILLALAALIMIPAASFAQQANSDILKKHKKEIKAKKKQFEDGGWQLYGTSRSFDVVLAKFYEKLDSMGNDGQEISGSAPRFSSKNVGHQMAFTSAANNLAQQNSGNARGVVENKLASNGKDVSEEVDMFVASFVRKVELEIKGQLEEAFSVIREIEPGVYEMESYFVYNKRSASDARLRAIKSAALESEATRAYADQIVEAYKEQE